MQETYFTRLKVGYPDERNHPPDQPSSWKVFTLCSTVSAHSCLTIRDIQALADEQDVSTARLLFRDLLNKASTGLDLTDLYDEKTCHEAHSFTHNHKDIKIFRIRRSAIRAYFIYYPGKIIILIKTKTKRSDKLSKGDKDELETIAKMAIDQINSTGFHQRIVI